MAGSGPQHYFGVAGKSSRGNVTMADQWVRLGMALTIIALISFGLYQFSARAGMAQPLVIGVTDRR